MTESINDIDIDPSRVRPTVSLMMLSSCGIVKKFEILLTFAVTPVILGRILFTLLVVGSMLFVVNISLDYGTKITTPTGFAVFHEGFVIPVPACKAIVVLLIGKICRRRRDLYRGQPPENPNYSISFGAAYVT